MALNPTNLTEVKRIEDTLGDVIAQLRKLRVLWEESTDKPLKIEFEKADGFVKYLHEVWIDRLEMQVKRELKAVHRESSVAKARDKKLGR